MAEEAVDGRRDAREVFVHQPRRLVDPLVAHEQEERDAEAGHDDQVDGAPLDDVDKQDAEDDDDEVADEAEAARKVELEAGARAPGDTSSRGPREGKVVVTRRFRTSRYISKVQ